MSTPLVVHLNRADHHSVEPETDVLESTGSFVLRLVNHGEGCHVHCSLDGDLVRAGRLGEDNPYVEADSTTEVPVEIRTDRRPVTGRLEIATGYGQESRTVDVTIEDAAGSGSGRSSSRDDSGRDSGAAGAPRAEHSTPPPTDATSVDPPWRGGSGEDPAPLPERLPSVEAVRNAPSELSPADLFLVGLVVVAVLAVGVSLLVFDGPGVVLVGAGVVLTAVLAVAYALTR